MLITPSIPPSFLCSYALRIRISYKNSFFLPSDLRCLTAGHKEQVDEVSRWRCLRKKNAVRERTQQTSEIKRNKSERKRFENSIWISKKIKEETFEVDELDSWMEWSPTVKRSSPSHIFIFIFAHLLPVWRSKVARRDSSIVRHEKALRFGPLLRCCGWRRWRKSSDWNPRRCRNQRRTTTGAGKERRSFCRCWSVRSSCWQCCSGFRNKVELLYGPIGGFIGWIDAN